MLKTSNHTSNENEMLWILMSHTPRIRFQCGYRPKLKCVGQYSFYGNLWASVKVEHLSTLN